MITDGGTFICAGRFLFVGLYVGVVCQCHRTTHERGSKSILLFYTRNQAPVLHVLSSRKEKKLKRNKKSGTRPHVYICFESCDLNFTDSRIPCLFLLRIIGLRLFGNIGSN